MRTSLSCLTFLLMLVAALAGCSEPLGLDETAPAPLPITPPSQADVRAAVDRGVAFLLETQRIDGSWGSPHSKPSTVLCPVPGGYRSFKAGTTSLCILALLEAGGDTPEASAAIDRGQQWLIENLPAVRRDSYKTLYNNWAHAYGLRALLALLERPGATDDQREQMSSLVRLQIHLLSRYQSLSGGWGYYQNHGPYSSRPNIPGTTFTTASIMISLYEARQAGFDVPDNMIQLALISLDRARSPNGSYEYYTHTNVKMPMVGLNQPPSSMGRTQVCNFVTRLYGVDYTTDNVIRAWLDRLYSRNGWLDMGRKRHMPHDTWFAVSGYFYYYGHYYASRCMELLPKAEWAYHQDHLANLLLGKQETDGSWWGYYMYRYHQQYDTAFAVMTLQRCLREEAE